MPSQPTKIKENWKRDKFLDFARELKTRLNMKVTLIPIDVLETIPKVRRLEEVEFERSTETIQTTTLLKLARILRRVWEIREDLQSLSLQWKKKRSVNGGNEKNAKNINNNNVKSNSCVVFVFHSYSFLWSFFIWLSWLGL